MRGLGACGARPPAARAAAAQPPLAAARQSKTVIRLILWCIYKACSPQTQSLSKDLCAIYAFASAGMCSGQVARQRGRRNCLNYLHSFLRNSSVRLITRAGNKFLQALANRFKHAGLFQACKYTTQMFLLLIHL